jgi:hypothetical protein
MPGDVAIVLLVGGLHLAGFLCATLLLFQGLRAQPSEVHSPAREEGEDDGGGSDRTRPRQPSGPRGGGLPLPDAVPARVRLRGPATVGMLAPRSRRRPAHAPRPRRVPASR